MKLPFSNLFVFPHLTFSLIDIDSYSAIPLKIDIINSIFGLKGNAYDNAMVKNFFGTLKCEMIYLQKIRALSDLIKTIDNYIYWYNHERIKLALGGYSLVQYRLTNNKMI